MVSGERSNLLASEKNKEGASPDVSAGHSFFPAPEGLRLRRISSAEEKRDAPQAGQGYQGVDHTAYRGILSSKEMSDDIVAEQPDAAPVDGADDHQDQSDSIQHAFTPSIR